jgi:hypothetical protein
MRNRSLTWEWVRPAGPASDTAARTGAWKPVENNVTSNAPTSASRVSMRRTALGLLTLVTPAKPEQ